MSGKKSLEKLAQETAEKFNLRVPLPIRYEIILSAFKEANKAATEIELVKWLTAEILDDEGAMINARDNGEWDRYHRLEGHKDALLHVKNHLTAMRLKTGENE